MNKIYPNNLTWEQWELIADLFPKVKPGGRPRRLPQTSETFIYIAMIRIMVRRLA